MVFQQLLLQKSYRSQVPSFSKCLQRRMDLWQQGDIEQLLHESWTIQNQLQSHHWSNSSTKPDLARQFVSKVTSGKLHHALRLLSDGSNGGVLQLTVKINGKSVRNILNSKHPDAEPVHLEAVIPGLPPTPPHPV